MNRFVGFTFALLVAGLGMFGIGCGTEGSGDAAGEEHAATNESAGEMSAADMQKRGEYLVLTLGCHDCHSTKKMTPEGIPVPDEAMALAGHPAGEALPEYDPGLVAPGKWILGNQSFTAYVGPWGVSYAANLTPDPTGIGGWTEEQFFKAMREGKYKGMDNTRMLLPPMPWPGYAKLPDEDIKALYAYLMSLKPIENAVPAAMPPAGAPVAGAGGEEGAASGA